jgi:hypothetical protein
MAHDMHFSLGKDLPGALLSSSHCLNFVYFNGIWFGNLFGFLTTGRGAKPMVKSEELLSDPSMAGPRGIRDQTLASALALACAGAVGFGAREGRGALPAPPSLQDALAAARSRSKEDHTQEEGGLCYKPCVAEYKSDGATICYRQYPQFEANGQGHTLTSITKRIYPDPGEVLTDCPNGEKQGALCYPRCREGFEGILTVCRKNCPAGTNQTVVRCEKASYGRGVGRIPDKAPCAAGWRDDGTSCWADYATKNASVAITAKVPCVGPTMVRLIGRRTIAV